MREEGDIEILTEKNFKFLWESDDGISYKYQEMMIYWDFNQK